MSHDYERVQRWDVYDIADELADLPWQIAKLVANRNVDPAALQQINQDLADLEQRLWAAADRGGSVGPSPEYLEV